MNNNIYIIYYFLNSDLIWIQIYCYIILNILVQNVLILTFDMKY